MNLKKTLFAATAAAALAITSFSASAQTEPKASKTKMSATKNIVETASATPALSTLVTAVKAAGLVDTLSSKGPFTVFAPTNDAFAKLPAGTVDTLLKPENKDQLAKILTYHVVPGKIESKKLVRLIKAGGGKAVVKTVQGEDLTFTAAGGTITITDAKGGTATVTTADLVQSNGVVHVIDTVLMP
jgi:uncharacterized surface protein with fasciclin (FAS1) repeats